MALRSETHRQRFAILHDSHDGRFDFVLAILVDLAARLLALRFGLTLGGDRLDFHATNAGEGMAHTFVSWATVSRIRTIRIRAQNYRWNFDTNASLT